MAFVTVSVATLPSVPLDFKGNCDRIKQSICIAKEAGATLRTGPELEVSGYGCLDHFHEVNLFFYQMVISGKWSSIGSLFSEDRS